MLERLEQIDLPVERKSIKEFEFPPTVASGYTVVTAQKISKAYGEKQIYKDFEFELVRGQKICFVGPNGAGKSTLLKMLAGVLPPDTGNIKLGHQVQRGYFSQTRLDVLNADRTALDELASSVSGNVPAVKMRSLLGLFNFHGDDVFKPVRVLSGGEKSRLILAKLLLNPPNFILLDEPTTHLDIDGVEALTKAFQQYEGTLCFISHDLFFIKEIANCIVEVADGQARTYPGGLDYYLDKKKEREAEQHQAEKKNKEQKNKEKDSKGHEQDEENLKLREARQRHKQALQRISEIKDEIKKLENEQKELETETYVKSRVLSNSFGKDPELLREYGQRLKWIPKRQREIAMRIKALFEERNRISG